MGNQNMNPDSYITAHPTLPEFEYIKPGTLAEASQLLIEHAGEARPLLGGTDIFVRMRDGVWKDKFIVDVKGLDGTDEIKFDLSTGLTIGSAVSMNRVSAHPDVMKHYSVLAERLGVSPFTAYDMLCLLEDKGMVTSEYQLSAEKSGPGRAERLFYPVESARERGEHLADQMGGQLLAKE